MRYFLYFMAYSFIGFLLETGYSLVTTGGFVEKKCYVFSLLCPVYGLGALAILICTNSMIKHPFFVFMVGALTATIVEFLVGVFYFHVFGLRIWNYSNMPYNVNGHICLLFTFFWGFLSLLLVYVVHPKIKQYTSLIPTKMCIVALILFIFDAALSSLLLLKYHQKHALSLAWLWNHS